MNEKQCQQAAIKCLAARSYSEQELRRRLTNKGYDRDTIDQVITDLCKCGYLNDLALCQALFDNYMTGGKYGIHAIVARLKKRELTDSIISGIVKEYDSEQGYQTAKILATRRLSSSGAVDLNNIGRFLAGRGFSTEIIVKVLEQLNDCRIE